MVNYGYGPGMKYWDESKKYELANKLRDMIINIKASRNRDIEMRDMPLMYQYHQEPYIEVDGLYAGVRIRKITHLSDELYDKVITEADKIYLDLMKPKAAK